MQTKGRKLMLSQNSKEQIKTLEIVVLMCFARIQLAFGEVTPELKKIAGWESLTPDRNEDAALSVKSYVLGHGEGDTDTGALNYLSCVVNDLRDMERIEFVGGTTLVLKELLEKMEKEGLIQKGWHIGYSGSRGTAT